MSAQPPHPDSSQFPVPGSIRCPRCSAAIGPEQDWCLECGAPARTRLAPTPNWQLPAVAIAAVIAVAGALLAFAFVRLTNDDGATPVGTTSTVVETSVTPPVVPVPTTTLPPATTPVPTTTLPPTTTPPPATATTGTTATPPATTGQTTANPPAQSTATTGTTVTVP